MTITRRRPRVGDRAFPQHRDATGITAGHGPRVVHRDAIGSAFDAVASDHVDHTTLFHRSDIAGAKRQGGGDRCRRGRGDGKAISISFGGYTHA